MNTGGPLDFHATLQNADFTRQAAEVERRIMGISSTAERESNRLDANIKRLGQLAAGAFAFSQLSDLPAQIVKVRSEFQSLEISLTTMLGSAAKAQVLLKEITQFAGTTPFSLKDAASGAKQLLAYGSTAKSVVAELRTLGDIAAGTGSSIGDLVYLYGTLRTQGRAYSVDIRQFASRGIPIYEELGRVLKINTSEVNAFVEAGKVGFKEVEQALKNMTTGSGLFAGLTEAQSKSLAGLKERLGDAYDRMLNDIGKKNQDIITGVIAGASEVVENYRSVVEILGIVGVTYGTYRAALLLSTAAQALSIKLANDEVVNAAAKLPILRAEVSALAAKKAELIQVAAAQSAAVRVAQAESVAAQSAAQAAATILDNQKRNALIRQAQVAQGNVLAAQETASIARKRAIAGASEFYAAKQALETTAVVAAGAAETTLTGTQALRASVTERLTKIQAALNTTMLANPYVVIGTLLAGIITATIVLADETVSLKSAQELLGETQKEVKTQIAQETSEIKAQLSVMQNKNVADSERLKAYEKLKSIAPDIIGNLNFEKAAIADLTRETQKYIDELQKRIQLEGNSKGMAKAIEQALEVNKLADEAREKYLKNQKAGTGTTVSGPDLYGNTFGGADYLKARADALARDAAKANGVVEKFAEQAGKIYAKGTKGALEAQLKVLEQTLASFKDTDKLGAAYKRTEDEAKKIREKLATPTTGPNFTERLATAQSADALRALKVLADTDDKLSELSKKVNEAKGSAKNGSTEKANLDKLDKEIDRLQGKFTAEEKKQKRDADKVGPFGTLSYWDNVVKKAQEVLDKTPVDNIGLVARNQAALENAKRKADEIRLLLETPTGTVKYFEAIAANAQKVLDITPVTDTAKIAEQKAILLKAQEDIEAARKLIVVRSFEEGIAEMEKQYTLYEKWVESYGQLAADSQFKDLISSGKSYTDYLNGEIAKLEAKRTAGTLSTKDAENLVNLNDTRNGIAGKENPFDIYRKKLDLLRESSGSTAQYIVELKKQLAGLPSDNQTVNIDSRKETAERINDSQRELQQELTSYLVSIEGSEQQRLAITNKYASLREAVEERYSKNKGKAYQDALARIGKDEANDIKEVNERVAQSSDAFKELSKVIVETGRAGLEKEIARLKEYVEKADEATKSTEEFKQELKNYNEKVKELDAIKLDNFGKFAAIAGEFGQALSSIGGTAGEVGGLLMGLSSGVGLLTQGLDKNLTASQRAQVGLQGMVSIVNILISSAQKRKQAEAEFYNSAIGAQQEYNLLLNQQIGLQSKMNSNVFVRDYAGELKDSFTQLDDAQKNYQKALDKLDEGKVKTGQKNAIDFGNVGSAAVAGAAIGSIIPGIGNVIGAVGGAIFGGLAGLFGGKKKEDVFGSLLQEYPKLIKNAGTQWEELDTQIAQSLVDNNQLDDSTKQLVQNAIDWQKQVEVARDAIKGIISDLASQLGSKLRDVLVNAFKDGEDAAQAFKSTVEDVLEDIVTNMLFSKAFKGVFDKFQEDMTKSLDVDHGGDGDLTDDFGRLVSGSKEAQDTFQKWLKLFKEQAASRGLDVLKPTDGAASGQSTALTNAVKGTSQETSSLIAGQMNAIRVNQAAALQIQQNIQASINTIAANSAFLKYLENIDYSLQRTFNGLRDKGIL